MLPEFPQRDERATPARDAPARSAPLKFEPTLVPRLLGAQKALTARFADLVGLIERDPRSSIAEIENCARLFGAMRQFETTALYPVLAHAVEGDAGARGQLLELRLIALMMARRAQRSFEELLQAVRAEVLVADAARRVSAALAKYFSHAAQATYPLYELVGTQRQDASEVA
jgi:hypothetical protein